MLDLGPICDRLAERGFAKAQGVLEFAAVTAPPSANRSVFVVPDRESAEPNRMSGVVDQRVTHAFSVVVVVRSGARDPDAPSEALREAANGVRDALIGWRHPDASAPVEFTGGDLLSVGGHLASWAVRFSSRSHLRRTPE